MQSRRQPEPTPSPTRATPEGQRMRRGAEEGQSITHADRMRPEATQSAKRGHRCRRGGEGHPQPQQRPQEGRKGRREGRRTPHTLTASQRLTEGTGAAHAAGGGAWLPWTPSRPVQTLRRSTGHDRRHGAQIPTHSAKTSHRRPGRAAEGARRIYLNMYRGTAAEPETRTAQGVAGTPKKS